MRATSMKSHTPPHSEYNSAPSAAERRTIVHLSKHCARGNGNVHVAVDLACEQARAGHDVYFGSAGGTFVPLLEANGVRHITLPQDPRQPLSLLRSAVRLSWLCYRKKISVIHAHMMGGALVGIVAARFSRIPLITTVHNSFDPHSLLMRLGDRIVAVSEAEKESLEKRGFPRKRLRVVWNAPVGSPRHDVPPSIPAPTLLRPSMTVICGLHKRKGVFDVIEAFSTIAAKAPDWTFYIAGEGPDRDQLEARVKMLGLCERIKFLGYVERPEYLYGQSDIFVLASYADPGSLTIGEARAAGCAIIATSVGGTPEMLGYGESGILVPAGRPDKLAAAMNSLVFNPELRAAMRASSLKGSEIFRSGRLTQDYGTIYDDSIKNRRLLKNDPKRYDQTHEPEKSTNGHLATDI